MRLSVAGALVEDAGKRLLGPIDLELNLSGVVVVLGHNGAGKSMFLRLIHSLLPPDAGRITWDGKPASQTRRQRGFVFQKTPLMRRSVAENVAFPLRVAGWRRSDIKRRVAQLLVEAQLEDKAQLAAASLSGGEQQRMALARALANEPDVVMLDEPSANLDPSSTGRLEEMIHQIRDAGGHVILSTHDRAQAERLANSVLVFENGQLDYAGSAEAYFSKNAAAQ